MSERDERVRDLVSTYDDVTLAGMYVDLEARLLEHHEALRLAARAFAQYAEETNEVRK